MAQHKPVKHDVDPKELETAQNLWGSFTKVTTVVVIAIGVVLGLMALFLT